MINSNCQPTAMDNCHCCVAPKDERDGGERTRRVVQDHCRGPTKLLRLAERRGLDPSSREAQTMLTTSLKTSCSGAKTHTDPCFDQSNETNSSKQSWSSQV